ncbi:hypothetical protein Slala03_71770 [Streptomyces lavendulae subsp. lavendulae]|nr:hypothetical protein Slala03_71770 [Streptomyces lavendulae subsp. lavendulae]
MPAALLRLTDTRGNERRPDGHPTRKAPVAEADLSPLSHVKLGVAALQGLSHLLGEVDVDEFETTAGSKRDTKLAKIVETFQKQAWELAVLGDEMASEHRDA